MQNSLNGGVLEVRRMAVLAEDVLDQNPQSGARRLAVLPVHGGIAFQPVQKLMGDDAKMVVPHCWSAWNLGSDSILMMVASDSTTRRILSTSMSTAEQN